MGPDAGGLSAKDICAIIEVCAKSRVSSLEYAGLQVKFDATTSSGWENPEIEFVDQPEGGETPSGGSQRGHSPAAGIHLSAEDKALFEESRLAQLMTDNPLAYEQEMIDAQLSQGVVHGGGEDFR